MDYTILINKENKLDENYVPENLVITDNNENNFHGFLIPDLKPQIDENVFDHFKLMQKDAEKNGFHILVDSGYRSYNYQQMIWDSSVLEIGLKETKRVVAPPGASEHQLGLAFDIGYIVDGNYTDDITGLEGESIWLFNNSYKYGFILRYPEGKEEITGYNYEPWHYRFVGVELATHLYENSITLEEYYIKDKIKLKH